MTHSVSVRETWLVNHCFPAHIVNNFEALIEKLYMNELDPKNVIIYKSLKKKRNKYSD